MIFSREDIFARGYFREKIFSREDIFAGRYFRVNSIFAKISSRENISNSLFAKFSSRGNKVLYSILKCETIKSCLYYVRQCILKTIGAVRSRLFEYIAFYSIDYCESLSSYNRLPVCLGADQEAFTGVLISIHVININCALRLIYPSRHIMVV